MSVDKLNIQSPIRETPPSRSTFRDGATSGAKFDDFLRSAAYESDGILSFDDFAKFTNVRMAASSAPAGSANAVKIAGEPAVEQPSRTNRDRFGDAYSLTGLPVVWDDAGDERITPGGGNPDEIINLIYELKSLGVSNAERFWNGAENGGQDHLSGFILRDQLKMSIVRRNEPLLSPAEYRAMGQSMMARGEEVDLYPNGFVYGS